MRSTAPRLAMVAGEASGDLLASLLLQGLAGRWPGLAAAGIGGPLMQRQGFQAWWPSEKLSVFGYLDALRHYRELLGIRRQLRDRLLAERPDLFIGVDAPDFNFGLEAPLRAAGIRTVHFVCPSIWAWRGERVKTLARAADHVLCLYPFEPALLAQHGVAATFVGHPLADRIPMEVPRLAARQSLGLGDEVGVVALLPGSRRSEIRHIAPVLLQAAALLARQRPALQFVLPMAPGLRPLIEPLVRAHAPGLALQLLEGRSHEALAACDLTLIASGTATLEAALFKRPMVIVYRMHWLNWQLMKGRAYQPWFGLPNILAQDFVVPERIQAAATPETLAADAMAWLDDAPRRERLHQHFTALHHSLRQNTALRASDAIAKILEHA
jgi:lipid-A-disaccharide synthase